MQFISTMRWHLSQKPISPGRKFEQWRLPWSAVLRKTQDSQEKKAFEEVEGEFKRTELNVNLFLDVTSGVIFLKILVPHVFRPKFDNFFSICVFQIHTCCFHKIHKSSKLLDLTQDGLFLLMEIIVISPGGNGLGDRSTNWQAWNFWGSSAKKLRQKKARTRGPGNNGCRLKFKIYISW